ncbi:MAG: Ig domain-containing protein [Cyclobacteriaceae bacterium]
MNSINLPPTVSVTVEDSYCYDEEFDIQIVASDPEGQPLQFAIGNGDPLPSGLNMNSETGLISGKIAGDGSGISQSHAIEVVVSDTEGEQTEILVSISVVDCEASMEVLSFN